ncbi:hypothetical protein RRG08_050229 [Elysia crispata]|uniref:Uncharacterized protein n=1 Tax=Elysia crispata TaxID=231223 RepID=A0AAE1B3U5_9GAST|nr:hypothetical protein RRG08_050229 [Elysia crispata]
MSNGVLYRTATLKESSRFVHVERPRGRTAVVCHRSDLASSANKPYYIYKFSSKTGWFDEFSRGRRHNPNQCPPTIGAAAPDCGLKPVDIVFLNDASGSVGPVNFNKTLVFIENVVKALVIGPYDAQIGFVTFETKVHLEFHLNTYSNQQDIVNRVRTTNFTSGSTATHLGLEFALQNCFTRANGSRTYASQVAIVIMEGKSDNANFTAAAAKKLRDAGVTVFSIGVGNQTDQTELNAIASDPHSTHVFSVDDFDSLSGIIGSLLKGVCETKPAFLCDGKADIMFLLESSHSVGPKNFDLALDFVDDITKNFFIGSDNVQVGVATFSTWFVPKINLGQYKHRKSLKSALSHIPFTGGAGTNTGRAIGSIRKWSFTVRAGHRANVPKLVVLVTSGQSTDRQVMFREVQRARNAGITILAIGVGPDIDDGEMKVFASDGGQNVYRANVFEDLKYLTDYVASNLCHMLRTEPWTSSQQTCGTMADIVFLVDSSGQEEIFKSFLNFIKSYIKDLDIGQDNIRVGIEMFSNRPYNEINLNRYNSKEELTKRINRIEPRRGGRDTAAAIKYMENSMFKTANGDRPEVPNIAIILTDGKSTRPEETKLAAERARNNGIVIFSVGVGNETSRTELTDMASDPDNKHVLTVTDFTKFNSIISAFQSQTCHAMPVTLPPYVAPSDVCEDVIPNCGAYHSVCDINWATTNCAKSCGFCSPSSPTVAPQCVDKIPDCPSYSASVCSGSSKQWARENCWRFCGYCSPGTQTVGVVNRCSYKGREYDQGDKWDDGCAYECECDDAEKGQYVCYNMCPSYFNLPNECTLEQKAGKCCLEPVCKFDRTYTSKEVNEKCVHNNKRYQQGQIWSEGCDFKCICDDAAKGFYACQSKCAKYVSLPSNCKLVSPPGECCERPQCEFQTQVGKFTGNGSSREPARVSAVTTTCNDKISDCQTYSSTCSSDTNRSFALNKCPKFCNLCDPEHESSPAGVCLYQGKSYEQGETWHDGCEKTCVCDDAESGYIRCEDRCPDFLNLPRGCSLVNVSGQCCRSLSCDTPGIFTRSQLRNDTVGALPVQVDGYPTLPPGQTHAPGQNPSLVVPTSKEQSDTTAQKTSPTTPSLDHSSSSGDGKVMTSKITCDPAQEDWEVLECNKLQVYALPDRPQCTVTEGTEYGSITSVNISCLTSKVYPKAMCSFYDINDGSPVGITESPDYTHTETGGTPVYYRSQCSVSVPVADLGEGTHRFQAYIYPNVTGGKKLVEAVTLNATVNLTMPKASHRCFPEAIEGRFPGNLIHCNCSLTSDGYPRGIAKWYKGNEMVKNVSDGVLVVTKNDYLDQNYTCDAVSDLGRKLGSLLTVKFAVKKVQSYHLPKQGGRFASALIVTAVVSTVIALAALLIKHRLSEVTGLQNLTSTADESPRVVQDGSFSATDKSLNNDLADPETALSDHQRQDEATSTFKPDQGPGFVAEPRVMLNPFFDQDLST